MIWGTPGLPWARTSLLWDFIASPYHLQFLLGIAVAAAVLTDRVPLPRTLLAVGIIGIVSTAALEDLDCIEYLGAIGGVLFGGFSACAIAGMAAAERKGMLNVGAVPLLFGESSYAIYLVHFQAIALMARLSIGSRLIHAMPGWLLMLALAVGGGAAGVAVHVVAERPILRWLRSVWEMHRPAGDPMLVPSNTRGGMQHGTRKTA
jgi:exopolysaccharide production protein ExoZ